MTRQSFSSNSRISLFYPSTGDRVLRISLNANSEEKRGCQIELSWYKFEKFGPFLTCLDRKKVILYLWTNLIETILVLLCSLFMLVSLNFVHKKLFSIIFTCLNMLSLFL